MTELAAPPVEQEHELRRISHWIGGRIVAGESGRSGPVFDPAVGRQTGIVEFASPAEVDRAVQAARAAFAAWRSVSLSRRTAIFSRTTRRHSSRRLARMPSSPPMPAV